MIRLSAHAEEMAEERRITIAWIEATVTQPDWTAPNPRDLSLTRSYRAIPERAGRILRVVHRPDGPDILVVTALFDRGARR